MSEIIRDVFGWKQRQKLIKYGLQLIGVNLKEKEEVGFWKKQHNKYVEWYKGTGKLYDVPDVKHIPNDRIETRYDLRQNALVTYALNTKRYQSNLEVGVNHFENRRVLDIGCGPLGTLVSFDNCERYGADPLITRYRALGYPLDLLPMKFVEAFAEELPFDDGFFDAVISVNALDHVDNFEKAISEVARVLRGGGEFLCSLNYSFVATTTEPELLSDERVLNAIHGKFEGKRVKVKRTEDLKNKGIEAIVLWRFQRID